MAKLGFKKSLILFCQEKSHIEGLAKSGVQYLPLTLDKRFFYFLFFDLNSLTKLTKLTKGL